MKEVNIIIGRFQPITNGHMRCADMAMAKTNCTTVLLMIDTPESKVDARHPFPSSMLLPIYKDALNDSNIIDIILVKNADIVKNSEILKEAGYTVRSWSCGTDRIEAYSKMANKYADRAGLPNNFEMIEIARGDDDESATKLREALLNDDRDIFSRMSPLTCFNELRKQILNVHKP